MTPLKNPIVVPAVLHFIIPCILLWTKAYNINIVCFWLAFSLSFIRTVITISFLCDNVVNLWVTKFVVFLDLVIVGVYIVFSIVSSEPLIWVFTSFYIMGFIWVAQEVRIYLKNVREVKDEEVIIKVEIETECCICYEGVIEGKMLSCGHIYHKECIDEWFKEKRICPYCRTEVR